MFWPKSELSRPKIFQIFVTNPSLASDVLLRITASSIKYPKTPIFLKENPLPRPYILKPAWHTPTQKKLSAPPGTHVSVCACLQQLHAWMVAMMMMIMFTILYIVMKCCKMDPSVILNEYSSWLFWAREIFHTYTHTHTPPPHTHTHNKRFSYLNNNCISWFIGFLHLGIGMITHTWFWIHDIMIHCRHPWFFF